MSSMLFTSDGRTRYVTRLTESGFSRGLSAFGSDHALALSIIPSVISTSSCSFFILFTMPVTARPGPLKDLPPAHFLASSASLTPTIAKPTKRPLSPSKSTIFSPAKRRILHSEGILLPGEAPQSSLRPQLPSFGSDVFGASQNSSILTLASPAQGAGATQGSSRDRQTPRRSSSKLTRYQCSTITSGDDSGTALSLRRSSRLQSSQPGAASMAILREMPLPHDRQSVHYPGFDTYQDTHVFLGPPRRASPSSDNEDPWSSSEEVLSEREISKENIPPRKKAKKSSLARSSLPIDQSFRSDRSTTREESRQLSGITASSRCIDGVVTPRAS
ncbi:uncharacterized protein EDB91DRAFT_525864 [Suillus paluster]|uniref:uncharacterized protein n=1 Tax=Suillus paluster TaxID=48578 RepID=UPI001B876A19|nr:uncharacterized protein EDB91DRAFT_525864 [Suillus paluster]KAG1752588.1 hypothetical protein EDB91DRAFT_525864 [Suillus paluster]